MSVDRERQYIWRLLDAKDYFQEVRQVTKNYTVLCLYNDLIICYDSSISLSISWR